MAQSKGIPIIGFDSGVPGAPEGAVLANAATDNYAAGALAAEKMYDKIKDQLANPAGLVRIGVVSQEANSDSIEPVSYTHLDVYKRQIWGYFE